MDFAFLPTAWDLTSGGAYRQLSPWPLAIALFFLGFVITFILAAYYFGSKRPEPGGEEAPPEPELPPEPPEAEVVEEAPPAPRPPEDLAAKVARLKAAYKEGKMSREAYEANLRRLGVEVPVEPPKPSEEEERQRKIERLRATYASGRISRTVYEDNLRALGVEPEPEPPKPEAAAKAPPLPPAARERLKVLNKSLAEGRITQERYERILADVYAEVDPRFAELRKDLEAHRIVQAEYDARVRRLLAERRG